MRTSLGSGHSAELVGLFPGHSAELVGLFLGHSAELVGLLPGHSQILSSPQLRDKIWEWPGNEATDSVAAIVTQVLEGVSCGAVQSLSPAQV